MDKVKMCIRKSINASCPSLGLAVMDLSSSSPVDFQALESRSIS